MNELEAKARAIERSRIRLKKRLMEVKSILSDQYRKRFKKNRFDFKNKRLVSDDSKLALQWKLRAHPERSVSYSNQQTSSGTVELLNIIGLNPGHTTLTRGGRWTHTVRCMNPRKKHTRRKYSTRRNRNRRAYHKTRRNPRYRVEYEVRNHGAIGKWRIKSDSQIHASSPADATRKFREKHQAKFEFRFPSSVTPL